MKHNPPSSVFGLALGLFLIAVVPLLSIWRVGPLPSFFLESGSLLFALCFVAISIGAGCLRVRLPASSIYWLVLAAFWSFQARWMHLTYPGMSSIVSYTFVILALMCWACRGWLLREGEERVVSTLAAVLMVGCVMQSVIGWLQYTGLAKHFTGYLMYRTGIVEGQLAQRNHFGHYLMWGVLSASWLWAQRRLPTILAAACVLLFASAMSLTGSRTVLAYVLMLAVWLPICLLLGGRENRRTVVALAAGALTVLICQYTVEPVLGWFTQTESLQSAVERMHGAQLEGSGRGYEWRKAWQIFLQAPWLGNGWGSYPLYGFLENVYPNSFRPYENNVLFTHSHNSFLNLLAEMGIIGTALVLGGLLWAVKGSLQRAHQPAGGFLLALIGVSLVHSMLEYPLWYIYFLTPFALFVGFTPPARRTDKYAYSKSSLHLVLQGAAALACLFFTVGIVRLAFVYQELRHFSGTPSTEVVKRTEQIVGLLRIAKTEPMLRYYAQFQLTSFIDPNSASQPDWAYPTARDALRYRPYANAHKYAFAAYREGKVEEARDWLRLMYHYYPSKMNAYAAPIMNTPHYNDLRADFTRSCQAYRKRVPEADFCAEALPTLPQKISEKKR